MSNYEVVPIFDEANDQIRITTAFNGEHLASYTLSGSLRAIISDEVPLESAPLPAVREDGKQVGSVLDAIGEEFRAVAFPDYVDRSSADSSFAEAFRNDHHKQLVAPDGNSFVDITELVQRRRERHDDRDLEPKIARDIEWIALGSLDDLRLSDMTTFFFLDDRAVALTQQFMLGSYSWLPTLGQGRNRALLERISAVAQETATNARYYATRTSGFVDAYLDDSMTPEEIRASAQAQDEGALQEWEFDQLDWTLDQAMPLDRFLEIMSADAWRDWFWNEQRAACKDGRAGYLNLLAGKIIEPVVVVLDEEGEQVVDLWDGWHRTAACFVRGEEVIKTISARSYKLDQTAVPTM